MEEEEGQKEGRIKEWVPLELVYGIEEWEDREEFADEEEEVEESEDKEGDVKQGYIGGKGMNWMDRMVPAMGTVRGA